MDDLFSGLPPGDRGGMTYSREYDYTRLNRQAQDVWQAMMDMRWHSLRHLSQATGHPEASVSARLRDFRKEKFGRHRVERERMSGGLFLYRLTPNREAAE